MTSLLKHFRSFLSPGIAKFLPRSLCPLFRQPDFFLTSSSTLWNNPSSLGSLCVKNTLGAACPDPPESLLSQESVSAWGLQGWLQHFFFPWRSVRLLFRVASWPCSNTNRLVNLSGCQGAQGRSAVLWAKSHRRAEIWTDLTLKFWEMETLVVFHPQQNADFSPREVIIITTIMIASISAFCGLSYST